MMDAVKQAVEKYKNKVPKDSPLTQKKLEELGITTLQLREYQVFGVNWLYNCYRGGLGAILCDEMGLGKTCQTISFLLAVTKLKKGSDRAMHLVVCPLSVIDNWCNELERFAPQLSVVRYIGDKEERGELRERMRRPTDVVVTTYELCLKDEEHLDAFSWTCLVVDEGHRLKNMESQLHQMLACLKVERRFILTGTPVQNNLSELFSLLHFTNPRIFRRHQLSAFVDRFSDDDADISGELLDLLKPFLLRRMKEDVLKDLPTKSEVILYHPISALQKKYYKAVLLRDYDAFDAGSGTRARLMNILMQLRKCVVHPYLFPGVEPEPFELGEHLVRASGKLLLIDRLLGFLRPRGHKVLLFSQFTSMLDILQDYMDLRGFPYERLDGSVRGEERFLSVKNFNQDSANFVFLVSTKAGGQGLNLASADTVVFVDSDFNPQNDLQAAARAHRIGQTRPVRIVRLVGRHTVEEIVLRRAEAKLRLTNQVLEGGHFALGIGDPGARPVSEELKDILRFGIHRLMADEEEEEATVDFEAFLGRSQDGAWLPLDKAKEETEEAPAAEPEPEAEEKKDEEKAEEEEAGPAGMYVFEGKDYSKEPSAEDTKALERLIEHERGQAAAAAGEYTLRRKNTEAAPALPPLALPAPRARRPLTEEQLAERRRRKEERLERQRREAAELAEKRRQQQIERLRQKWEAAAYKSLSVELVDKRKEEEDDEEEEEEEEERDIRKQLGYLIGDVVHPQKTGNNDAIICHCVDDCGRWGRGGVFDAIALRSPVPAQAYARADEMEDLRPGDVHLVPCDDLVSRDRGGHDFVALMVAHERDGRGRLKALSLGRLEECLRKVAQVALQRNASVHLPRLGHNTPSFNWYGVERCIKKYLAEAGVPTYIYYYARRGHGGTGGDGGRGGTAVDTVSDSDEEELPAARSPANSAAAKAAMGRGDDEADAPEGSAAWRRRQHLRDISDSDDDEPSTAPPAKRARQDAPGDLSGVVVHLAGVSQPGRFVRDVERLNGGLARRLSPAVTHVVVGPDHRPPNVSSTTHLVTLEWLEESVRDGHRADEKKFPVK